MIKKEQQSHIKLSLCMIVKDESKNLDRCLTSVKDIVDEIIIVDTGSKDNTVEIAKKYTSNIYNYKWENDFSEARNFSISKATGQWILVLDADEELAEISKLPLKSLLLDIEGDIVFNIRIKNISIDYGVYDNENYMARMFKNSSNIRYSGRIHESINTKAINLSPEDIYIIHHGYKDDELNKKKSSERNRPIFEEILNDKNSPDTEKIIMKYYLAQIKVQEEDLSGAEKDLLEFTHEAQSIWSGGLLDLAFISLFNIYVKMKDFNKLEFAIEQSKNQSSSILNRGEYWFYKGYVEVQKSNDKEALPLFLKSVEIFKNLDKTSFNNLNIIDVYFFSLLNVCSTSWNLKETDLFNKYISIYLDEAKNSANHLINLANLYFDIKKYNEAIDLNNKIISFAKGDIKKTALNNLSKIYMFLNYYTKAIEIQSQIHDPEKVKFQWYKLAEALEDSNNLEEAEKIYSKIIQIIPNDFHSFLARAALKASINSIMDSFDDLKTAYSLSYTDNDKLKVISILIKLGSIEEAKKLLLENLSNNPDSYDFNLFLSKIYQIENNFEEANILLNKLLKLYDKEIGAYIELAVLYINSNDYIKSYDLLLKASSIEPENLEVLYYLGMVLIKKNMTIEAEKIIDKGLDLNPNNISFQNLKREILCINKN